MIRLSWLELAFGQLFLNDTWLGVCALVWDFSFCLIEALSSHLDCCCLMIRLCSLELVFGHLLFNYTWLSVCVRVWAFSCCVIESTVITPRLLLSRDAFVLIRAGLWPALSQSRLAWCLCACLGLLLLSD